jgi:hypothetical protein
MPLSLKKIALGLLLAACAAGHELQDNRATLVLRDRTHLSVTLYLSYPEALHQALAPQRQFLAFLLIYSEMKTELLQKELLRAQARFQSTTHLYLPDKETSLVNWVWPDAKAVQSMLQRRVMQAMVDPDAHAHEAPVEVHADANAALEIQSVRVQFPLEWQRVLVVWYRPSQQWVEGATLSPAMKF